MATLKEAEERVFFVSARETLQVSLNFIYTYLTIKIKANVNITETSATKFMFSRLLYNDIIIMMIITHFVLLIITSEPMFSIFRMKSLGAK